MKKSEFLLLLLIQRGAGRRPIFRFSRYVVLRYKNQDRNVNPAVAAAALRSQSLLT